MNLAKTKANDQAIIRNLRTNDIARQAGIHVNTVRFYERIGYISEIPRDDNNYRVFSERHLFQVLVLRYIFLDEWPGRAVRKASLKIIDAMKLWNISLARQRCRDYLEVIQHEIDKTITAVSLMKEWSSQLSSNRKSTVLDFNQTAAIIGTTRETIRNWERNRLIKIPRNGRNNKRYFTDKELDRLRVIYLLRQARFSIAAVYQALRFLDYGKKQDAIESLESPSVESIISTGDHVLQVLYLTHAKAIELLAFLETIPT